MNFMERAVVFFIFIFLMSGVFGAAGDGESSIVDDGSSSKLRSSSSEDGKFYTQEFYIFLGIAAFFVLVLGIFIWFWLRGPRNQWEK